MRCMLVVCLVSDVVFRQGYTYWTAAMIPVSIEAKVKPLVALENSGRDGFAPTTVAEKGTIDFMSASVNTGPFSRIATVAYDQVSESTRASEFSRSTRAHLEFVECTESRELLAVERSDQIPRFRLATGAISHESAFEGDYVYHASYVNDTLAVYNRIYELDLAHSYEAPTVAQLQVMRPRLTLRANHETLDLAHAAWWRQHDPTLGTLDDYNEAYSTQRGLCMISRLHMYEPSSCDRTMIDSLPYYIHAAPVNVDNANLVSVSFNPDAHVWAEDQTVPLRINATHAGSGDDSSTW